MGTKTSRVKKVLVIGGDGFFGSWLVPSLKDNKFSVDVYDLKNGDNLFDTAELNGRLQGCRACIHLAAIPHYNPTVPPQNFVHRNILGTMVVTQACVEQKVESLVFASSGALYGFNVERPHGWVEPPITETPLLSRVDWTKVDLYGASKIASEIYLEQIAENTRLTVTSLRINNIEPHMNDAHWGWKCSQGTASRAFVAALKRKTSGFVAVNVGEPCEHLDLTVFNSLCNGEL